MSTTKKDNNFNQLLMNLLKSKDEKLFSIVSKLLNNNIDISETPEYNYLNNNLSLLKKDVKEYYNFAKNSILIITKDIKDMSKLMNDLVKSITILSSAVESHARSIEDLYKAQTMILNHMKGKVEDSYALPIEKKDKKNDKPN